MRYCIPARTFLDVQCSWPFFVPDRSPFLTVHRSWPFTVPDRSPFLTVHRSWPLTVPDRSPFLSVPDRSPFMTVPDRSRAFSIVLWAFYERFLPFYDRKRMNGQERWTVRNGERSGTVNGQEHLGTIESERSNALERIVENGHGTFTVRSRYGHAHASKTKETL